MFWNKEKVKNIPVKYEVKQIATIYNNDRRLLASFICCDVNGTFDNFIDWFEKHPDDIYIFNNKFNMKTAIKWDDISVIEITTNKVLKIV